MKRWHIFVLLPMFGLLLWIIQGAVMHILFTPRQPASIILTGAGANDIFIRGFALGLFLSFGLAAMLIIRRLSRAEHVANRLNSLLRAVRDVGQIITRESDPHRLITNACKSLTGGHGFTKAWIVLQDRQGNVRDAAGTVDPVSLSKIVERFKGNRPPCCARTDDENNEVLIIRDAASFCSDCPVDDRGNDDWIMSMRLEHAGNQYGVMTVSVSPGFEIEGEETALFREVGNDFAHALYAIEQEQERTSAARALVESKERYQTLFDSAADSIFIHDADGRILEVNSAACERLEYGHGELEEMKLADIEDPSFRERRISFIKRIHRDGHTMYETAYRTRSGRIIQMEVSSRLIEYRGDNAIQSIARDVTDRKKAGEMMALYRLAVEATGDMIVAVDRDYHYILANDAFLRYNNLSREKLFHLNAEDVIDPVVFETELRPRFNRCLAGEVIRFELKRSYPHLGERWQHLSYFPLRGDNREIIGIVASIRDITDRKQHEETMALYQNAVEASGDMLVAVDNDYRYILANDAFLRYHGLAREDFIGKTASEFVDATEYEKDIKPRLDRCLAGEEVRFELCRHYPHIGECWQYLSYFPLRGEDREIRGIVVSMADITERKRMEGALRESENRYRTLFENMLNGFVHLKVETGDSNEPVDLTVIDLNASFESIIGMKKEDMIGRRVTELFPGIENLEYDWIGEFGRVALNHETVSNEVFIQGTGNWVVFNAFCPGDGYVAALFENITERRRAEQSLAHERHLLRALMDNIPVNIYFKDRESRFIMINRDMLKRFKLDSTSEAVGKSDRDFHSPEVAEKAMMDERQVMETGEPIVNMEEHEVWPDGAETWIATTKVPLRDEQGETTGIIGTSLDITERKILENQLRQAQKMETVARLAGGVAHDFNNMLTAIMGYCNILMIELPEGGKGHEDVQEILATAQRAADLTRQLLAFSRRQIIKPRVVNLNDILTNLDRMLQRLIGENITMVLRTQPDLWPVRIDPGQVEQVLTNLAVNARDAMPEGGRITIETGNAVLDAQYARVHPDVRPGPHVQLAVTDTGVGIDENTIGRIFEPFYTTKGMGTGLGLSTCYGIVKQNKGNIWVYSEEGRGTCFKIYLPRAEGAADEPETIETDTPLPTGAEYVLLAEDEKAVRDATKRILTGLGYQVIPAVDGREAIELAESKDIDLLITDVVMPNLGGKELAEALNKLNPDIRVLYMSGYTDNAIVSHGVLDEDIAFIQKPFMAAELAKKVREVLDGE